MPSDEATFRNNQGISLLQEARYGAAIKELFAGLNLVKQLLAENNHHATCNDDDANYDDEEGEAMETQEDSEEDPSRSLVDHDDLCFVPSQTPSRNAAKGELFAFQCPLLVQAPPPTSTSTDRPHTYHVKLSFVLLYNLALAHHLSALESDVPSNKKLRKALSLYELAYTVQVTEDMPLTIVQTMAIVNNLGHVHALLGSIDQSEHCFQHLLSTILMVNDCAGGMQGQETTIVPHMDGFVSNVLNLMLEHGTPSAPAA